MEDSQIKLNPAATPEPMPTMGRQTVLPHVLKDLMDRAIFGEKKYKTLLKTSNGRDALLDAYQEQLDNLMYLKQAMLERDERGHAMSMHPMLCEMPIVKQLEMTVLFTKEQWGHPTEAEAGVIIVLENALEAIKS